jgi:hypothetical protein
MCPDAVQRVAVRRRSGTVTSFEFVNDPGSAAHHFVLRCAREMRRDYEPAAPSAFSISGLIVVSRFSGVIGPTNL